MARGWAGLGLGVLAFVSAAAMARAALAPIDGGAGSTPPAPWQLSLLPQQKEPVTRFVWVDVDGRAALRVQADRSYGNLVHALSPDTPVRTLSWRWRVDEPNARADLRTREEQLRLMARRQVAIREAERKRLGLDLHDGGGDGRRHGRNRFVDITADRSHDRRGGRLRPRDPGPARTPRRASRDPRRR